jgi:hypothetical protein
VACAATAKPDRTATPEKLQAAQEQLAGAKTAADLERALDGHNHATLKMLAKALAQKAHGGSKAIARRIAAHLSGRGEDDGLPRTPEPGRAYNARTDKLKVDPARFQYKLNTDNAAGVTDEMKGVRTWNPDFAGVISVWQDPETGETFVVNGHHRHELATRLGAETLAVRYIKAKSAKEARAIGALINIAEGRGTAVDAAKFLRDSGLSVDELAGLGVSLKGKVAADAAVLTRLNDRLFDRVARGLMDEQQALAVAKHLADPALQDQLVGLLERREEDGKETSNKVVEEMAREMAATPTTTTTTKDLFGDIESTESLFVPRNELKAHIRNELAREVNDWAAVGSKRRAARVAGAGNQLDVEKNQEVAGQVDRAKNAFDLLVNRKGGISDTLNAAAEAYAKAKTKKEKEHARQQAYEAVRKAVFDEAGVGETDAAGKGGGAG